MTLKRTKKKSFIIIFLSCIIVFLGFFAYPRYQLGEKGYDKEEIRLIMKLDRDERKIFFQMPYISDLLDWMTLSDRYETYIDYQDYRNNWEITAEESVEIINLVCDNPKLFVFSKPEDRDHFLSATSPDQIRTYYQTTDQNQLCQDYLGMDALVNHEQQLSMSYIPEDLERCCLAGTAKEETFYLRKEANEALQKMQQDADQNGYVLLCNSAYRSYQEQAELYAYYLDLYGQSYCDQYVALPGGSEHQTGLAVDLTCQDVEDGQYLVFGDSPAFQWVLEHCADYGYIYRYPEEKRAWTGIENEPWHFRYVGLSAAKKLQEQQWCLEEYWAN